MEPGICTFGEFTRDPGTGNRLSGAAPTPSDRGGRACASGPRLDRSGRDASVGRSRRGARTASCSGHYREQPERFAPLVALYPEAASPAGHDPASIKIGINTHAYIADESLQAADEFFPAYARVMTQLGLKRGWPPATRQHFEAQRDPRGALTVGIPQEVIDKILPQYELFRHDRYLAQFSLGTMPHRQIMRSIELMGTRVAQAVRMEIARRAPV